MNANYFYSLPNVTSQELGFIQEYTKDLNDSQKNTFLNIYSTKRRDPQHILLFTLVGFLGFAGIQRFVTNSIGLGVLYFFTAGLCFIGTIVDVVNYQSIANEYNQKMAFESVGMIKWMSGNTNNPV